MLGLAVHQGCGLEIAADLEIGIEHHGGKAADFARIGHPGLRPRTERSLFVVVAAPQPQRPPSDPGIRGAVSIVFLEIPVPIGSSFSMDFLS